MFYSEKVSPYSYPPITISFSLYTTEEASEMGTGIVSPSFQVISFKFNISTPFHMPKGERKC